LSGFPIYGWFTHSCTGMATEETGPNDPMTTPCVTLTFAGHRQSSCHNFPVEARPPTTSLNTTRLPIDRNMRISHIPAARRLCPRVVAPLRLYRCQSSVSSTITNTPVDLPPESLSLSEWSAAVEGELVKLASRPLRPLTLVDLVRCVSPSPSFTSH
jgi:hypothetical protein